MFPWGDYCKKKKWNKANKKLKTTKLVTGWNNIPRSDLMLTINPFSNQLGKILERWQEDRMAISGGHQLPAAAGFSLSLHKARQFGNQRKPQGCIEFGKALEKPLFNLMMWSLLQQVRGRLKKSTYFLSQKAWCPLVQSNTMSILKKRYIAMGPNSQKGVGL